MPFISSKMYMTSLLAKLTKYFRHSEQQTDEQKMVEQTGTTPTPSPSESTPCLCEKDVKHLMHMLEHTHEGTFSCEETFELLDEYVELIASREEATLLMPYVQRHLDLCPGCREEYEVLLRILQTEFPPVA